jgi:uncharacterized paraquat-inducible protein A
MQRVLRFAPFRQAEAQPAPPGLAAGGAPCAYHAGNAASHACRRCGSFICSLCALRVGAQSYCPPCFERLRQEGGLDALRSRYERPHALALALGLLANLLPLVGLLLAPAGIWLGVRAFRRRAELSEREGYVALKAVSAAALSGLAVALHVAAVALVVRERTP